MQNRLDILQITCQDGLSPAPVHLKYRYSKETIETTSSHYIDIGTPATYPTNVSTKAAYAYIFQRYGYEIDLCVHIT